MLSTVSCPELLSLHRLASLRQTHPRSAVTVRKRLRKLVPGFGWSWWSVEIFISATLWLMKKLMSWQELCAPRPLSPLCPSLPASSQPPLLSCTSRESWTVCFGLLRDGDRVWAGFFLGFQWIGLCCSSGTGRRCHYSRHVFLSAHALPVNCSTFGTIFLGACSAFWTVHYCIDFRYIILHY